MDKSKFEIIDLSTDAVGRIFEGAEKRGSQGAYLVAFYTAIYGFPLLEEDSVQDVCGFPKAAPGLAETLMERATAFDKEHSEAMPGGLLVNNGPSEARWLDGMEVAVPPIRLEGTEGRVSPGEARAMLFEHPRRKNDAMDPITWIEGRSDATVKDRVLVEDVTQIGSWTVGQLAEEIKDEIFLDEWRHAGRKTTAQIARMLREDGALLYLPHYLDEEYLDEGNLDEGHLDEEYAGEAPA
jgi:hypothetical protein